MEKNFKVLEERQEYTNKNSSNNNIGFWKRFTAILIDLSLYILPLFILSFIVIFNQIIDMTWYLLFYILYIFIYYNNSYGFGYKIMKFKIIDYKKQELASRKKLFLRAIYKYWSLILYLASSIIFMVINFDDILKLYSGEISINNYFSTHLLFFNFLSFLLIATIVWIIVNAFFIGLTKEKRAIYDKISGVSVISEKKIKGWYIFIINVILIFSYQYLLNITENNIGRNISGNSIRFNINIEDNNDKIQHLTTGKPDLKSGIGISNK